MAEIEVFVFAGHRRAIRILPRHTHKRVDTLTDASIELWGGLECTVNRVQGTFFDQHTWSGHRPRVREDLELIASLGIRTLRTALHWEYFTATNSWAFFDRTLAEMQRLGLEPIAGLVHHGSGPPGTDLLDPLFPQKLAAYASTVAGRYPQILRYTPVNEPNTTGRFACLYGHWYPHKRSLSDYLHALLNEVKATVLAMQAIRVHQPLAELVYTEDGGGIFSTPEMDAFRVAREHRRWLGTDLLCGRVDRAHPLHDVLLEHGFSAEEIAWFAQNPCPPAVIGLNYYLTSDRFLDHRVSLYPAGFRGGDSGSEPLVDIEALRVRPEGIVGVGAVLRDAWDRYGIPVAVTEVHLGGGTDDQIRWLAEIWNEAQAARADGVDVRAVTIWALMGSWNWSTLCTRDAGSYEPGVFALVDDKPQRTDLSRFVAELAAGTLPRHPALKEQGWWRHADRIEYRDEAELAATR